MIIGFVPHDLFLPRKDILFQFHQLVDIQGVSHGPVKRRQPEKVVDAGQLDPETIVLPGLFMDRIVQI